MKMEVQGLPSCAQPMSLRKNQVFYLSSLFYILSEQIPVELRIQGLASIWTDGVLRAMRKAVGGVERIKAFPGLAHPSLHFPSHLRPPVFPPAQSLEFARAPERGSLFPVAPVGTHKARRSWEVPQ